MRSRIAALVLTALLGVAAPASASTTFKFVNPGTVTAYGYYVGQYNGLMGETPILLNCVDFFHRVENGQVWEANLTDLSGTDAGLGTVTRFNSLQLYRKAAFLTTKYAELYNADSFDPDPDIAAIQAEENAAKIGEIQATIWGLFSENGPTPDPGTTAWLDMANNYVATNSSADAYAGFYIVSDVANRLANGDDNPDSVQEFVVVIPEPATMMLVATGMAGLAGLGIRRRRKS